MAKPYPVKLQVEASPPPIKRYRRVVDGTIEEEFEFAYPVSAKQIYEMFPLGGIVIREEGEIRTENGVDLPGLAMKIAERLMTGDGMEKAERLFLAFSHRPPNSMTKEQYWTKSSLATEIERMLREELQP